MVWLKKYEFNHKKLQRNDFEMKLAIIFNLQIGDKRFVQTDNWTFPSHYCGNFLWQRKWKAIKSNRWLDWTTVKRNKILNARAQNVTYLDNKKIIVSRLTVEFWKNSTQCKLSAPLIACHLRIFQYCFEGNKCDGVYCDHSIVSSTAFYLGILFVVKFVCSLHSHSSRKSDVVFDWILRWYHHEFIFLAK